jgi:hypothetical protein
MNSCLDYVLTDTKWLFLSSYDVISHSYLPGCYRVIINLVTPLTALNTPHMRVLYGWGGGGEEYMVVEQSCSPNGVGASLDVWFSRVTLNFSNLKHTHVCGNFAYY